MQRYGSPSTPYAPEGILFASSTKGARTRRWNCAYDRSLSKSIERNPNHHAAYVNDFVHQTFAPSHPAPSQNLGKGEGSGGGFLLSRIYTDKKLLF